MAFSQITWRWSRWLIVYFHDLFMTALSLLLAFYIRFDIQGAMDRAGLLLFICALILVLAMAIFPLSGMYKGFWRYASIRDLVNVTQAVTILSLVAVLIVFLFPSTFDIPRTVIVANWFCLLFLLCAPRIIYQMAKDSGLINLKKSAMKKRGTPVLLVGEGSEAANILRVIEANSDTAFHVLGVIGNSEWTTGREVLGTPVLGTEHEFEAVVRDLEKKGNRPRKLLLTEEALTRIVDQSTGFLVTARKLGLPYSTISADVSDHSPLGRQLNLSAVDVSHILGRQSKSIDRNETASLLQGRRVVVTGAGGTIGAELCNQIAALRPSRLMIIDNSEYGLYHTDQMLKGLRLNLPIEVVLADIRSSDRVNGLFADFRPELIFHAAALKHVGLVENNRREAVLTNVFGTHNVASAAMSCGALAMVNISTDKAVAPSSFMGATKRIAEAFCQAADADSVNQRDQKGRGTRFLSVRFGNVLGSSGSVLPLFRQQIANGGPVTVTDPAMERFFMSVSEAVGLVLVASNHGLNDSPLPGGILVLDMGVPVKIVDVARKMIEIAGYRPDKDIKIVFTGAAFGEKLSEKLATEKGDLVATEVPSVMVAKPSFVTSKLLQSKLALLEEFCQANDEASMVALVQELVDDYSLPAQSSETDFARQKHELFS